MLILRFKLGESFSVGVPPLDGQFEVYQLVFRGYPERPSVRLDAGGVVFDVGLNQRLHKGGGSILFADWEIDGEYPRVKIGFDFPRHCPDSSSP